MLPPSQTQQGGGFNEDLARLSSSRSQLALNHRYNPNGGVTIRKMMYNNVRGNLPLYAEKSTRNVILSTYQVNDSTLAARNDASAMSDRFSKSTVFLGSNTKLVNKVEINSTSESEKDALLASEAFVPTLNSRIIS